MTTSGLYERFGRYVEEIIDSHDRVPLGDLEHSIRHGLALVKAGHWDTTVWKEQQ